MEGLKSLKDDNPEAFLSSGTPHIQLPWADEPDDYENEVINGLLQMVNQVYPEEEEEDIEPCVKRNRMDEQSQAVEHSVEEEDNEGAEFDMLEEVPKPQKVPGNFFQEGCEPRFGEVLNNYWKLRFHRNLNPPGYYVYSPYSNMFTYYSMKMLADAYSFLKYSKLVPEKKGKPKMVWRDFPFIPQLLSMGKVEKLYDGVCMYPNSGGGSVPEQVGINICNPGTDRNEHMPFNLWTPFVAELYFEVEGFEDLRASVLDDFNLLLYAISKGDRTSREVDMNDTHFQALLKSTAAVIQRAHLQHHATVFQGPKGVGKSTFILWLVHILGQSKVSVTEDALRDVFGQFNSMVKSLVVVMNEVDRKDVVEHLGKLKALVTEKDKRVGDKHEKVSRFSMFCKVYLLNNVCQECILKEEEADRRFSIHLASDLLKRDPLFPAKFEENNAYFSRVYKNMEDPKCVRFLFEYLKSVCLDGYDSSVPFVTDFQKTADELTLSIKGYLADFVLDLLNNWFIGPAAEKPINPADPLCYVWKKSSADIMDAFIRFVWTQKTDTALEDLKKTLDITTQSKFVTEMRKFCKELSPSEQTEASQITFADDVWFKKKTKRCNYYCLDVFRIARAMQRLEYDDVVLPETPQRLLV